MASRCARRQFLWSRQSQESLHHEIPLSYPFVKTIPKIIILENHLRGVQNSLMLPTVRVTNKMQLWRSVQRAAYEGRNEQRRGGFAKQIEQGKSLLLKKLKRI